MVKTNQQDIALREPAEARKKRRALSFYLWGAMVGTTGTFLHWLAMVLHYVNVKPEMRLLTHIVTFLNFLLLAMVLFLKSYLRRSRKFARQTEKLTHEA